MTTKPATTAIPAIRTGRALQSFRESGFSLPAALGEVVDNALEADANRIVIDLHEAPVDKKRKAIDRIAIVDDGIGMNAELLQQYLVLGFSTRYMRTDTIGKFGVGATLAGVTFGQRIDVWSRDTSDGPLLHAFLDLELALADEEAGRDVGIDAPTEATVPEEFAAVAPPGTGTLVVWSKIDRLSDHESPRDEIVRELSRTFREQLNGGIKISILTSGANELALVAWDPTMRLEGTRVDEILQQEQARNHPGGPEGWAKDKTRQTHFAARVVFDDDIPVAGSKIHITITVYPTEILRTRGKGADALAKKLGIHDRQGKVSFVRHGREINYAMVPQLWGAAIQERDRFIGVEVRFTPELDRLMGVRNVKRGAEPVGELRQAIRQTLKAHIPTARKLIETHWRDESRNSKETAGEHNAINDAVSDANRNMPKGVHPEAAEDDPDVLTAFEDLATDVGKTDPEEREAYINRVKQLPFIVESVDWPGDQLFEIVHAGRSTIVRLNTRHRFYRELYAPLRNLSQQDPETVIGEDAVSTARRAAEAITLLFIAYAKAESMHETPDEQYNELRGWWGNFANYLMGKVKDVLD